MDTQNRVLTPTPSQEKMMQRFQSWQMGLFFLKRLPSAWFWGLKIKSVSLEHCEVKLPFSWYTQNPFRSIYFSALAGAGELSTGMLALLAIEGKGRVSMLVTRVEVDFVKKADSTTIFRCDEGVKITEAVERAIATGEGQTVTITSIGTKADGAEVARLKLTWSFKKKN